MADLLTTKQTFTKTAGGVQVVTEIVAKDHLSASEVVVQKETKQFTDEQVAKKVTDTQKLIDALDVEIAKLQSERASLVTLKANWGVK